MSHISLKRIFIVLVMLTVGTVLTLGTVQAADVEELRVGVVVNTSDYKWITKLLKQYEQETGIKIVEHQFNTSDYIAKYSLAFQAKKPRLDIIMIWDFFLPQMVSGRLLLPLDGSADPSIKFSESDLTDFFKSSLDAVTFDGHIYAVPESLDAGILYYRTDAFAKAGIEKVPESWDELLDAALKLKKHYEVGYAFICGPGADNTYTFFELISQAGGRFFDEKGKPVFNSEAGVKALQFMVDLRNKHKVVPEGINTYTNNEVHTGYLNGTFPMVRHWPYLYGMVVRGDNEKLKEVTRIAPLPYDKVKTTSFNNWTYAIPTIAEHPREAWQLVSWLVSKKNAMYEMLSGTDMPARKSTFKDPQIAEKMKMYTPLFDLTYEVLPTAVPMVMPEGSAIQQILGQEIDKAMIGSVSPKQALDDAAAGVEKLLKKR